MAHLSPVDASYLDTAPTVVVAESVIRAPAARVWETLIDNEGWAMWFPGVKTCTTTSENATGVGSTRTIEVGGLKVEEEFNLWEPEKAWGFTVVKCNVAFAKKLMEAVRLEPVADDEHHTTVTYIGAMEFTLIGKVLAPVLKRQFRTSWLNAWTNLDAHLSATTPT
jgi:uncharacterized protein YndB with AHSA1/START domain